MGEGILYRRQMIPNVTYDWDLIFDNPTFLRLIFPTLIDYVNSVYLEIPDNEFEDNINYKTATFLACYKDIGVEAFANAKNLINVSFPLCRHDSECYDIKYHAFSNCKALLDVTMNTPRTICSYAFNNLNKLTRITVGNNIDPISYITEFENKPIIYKNAINNCPNLEQLEIPYINEIAPYAFESFNFENLTFHIGDMFCSKIGSHAFKDCIGLSGTYKFNSLYSDFYKSITTYVWETVKPEIGEYAFESCYNLENFLAMAIHKIGSHAFEGCSSLNGVFLGSRRQETDRYSQGSLIINEYAFANCSNLQYLSGGLVVDYIGSHAFENCTSLSIIGEYGSLGYSLIRKISDYAFAGCINISRIIINYYCYTSNNIEFDTPLRVDIASTAFKSCTNLQEIVINGGKDIKDNTFIECTKLSSIRYDAMDSSYFNIIKSNSSIVMNHLINIGSKAFYNLKSFHTFSINYVNTIYDNAFENVYMNEYATMWLGRKICLNIKSNAFKNASLGFITFNELDLLGYELNVESYAFNNGSFGGITLYNVHSISDYAFNSAVIWELSIHKCNCLDVELNATSEMFNDCDITDSLKLYDFNSIYASTFSGLSTLHDVELGVNKVGSHAFENCINLRILSFVDNNLKYIGEKAFSGCSKLSQINMKMTKLDSIPELVSSDAFYGLFSDYRIYVAKKYYNLFISSYAWSDISDHIYYDEIIYTENIPDYCFYGDPTPYSSMGSEFKSVHGYIGSHAFEGCSTLEQIYFSSYYYSQSSAAYIGEYAFSGCDNLEYFICSTVKNIKEYAFYSLPKLRTVDIGSGSTYSNSYILGDIRSHAFENCIELSGAYIRTVNKIGAYAFNGCCKLRDLPGNMICRGIGSHAFEGISNIYNDSAWFNQVGKSLISVIGDEIIIDSYAFTDCSNLYDFSFPGANVIKSHAFENCQNLHNVCAFLVDDYMLPYYKSYLSTYAVTIEGYAFNNCPNLQRIEVSYIKEIQTNAFNGISFNAGYSAMPGISVCQKICDYAFSNCNVGYSILSFNSYGFSLSVKCHYDRHAFDGIIGFERLTIYNPDDTYESQFMSHPTLRNITLCPGYLGMDFKELHYDDVYKEILLNIAPYTFKDCLLSIAEIDMVNTIGSHAFEGCLSLQYGSVGRSLCFKVEDYAFYGCTNLSSMEFNLYYYSLFTDPNLSEYYDNKLEFSTSAFRGLDNLQSVNIYACKDLPSHLFEGFSKLSTVYFTVAYSSIISSHWESVIIDIGEYAFANLSTLQYLTCSYVSTIKSHAFENCFMSTYYFNVGQSICTKIEEYAFNSGSIQYMYFNQSASRVSGTIDDFPKLTVESYAFNNFSVDTIWLTNVKEISDYAINNIQNSLTIDIFGIGSTGSVSWPLTITSRTIHSCPNISALYFSYIDKIESHTFESMSNLNYLTASLINEIGDYAFANCSKLRSMDVQQVKKIGSHAFENCSSVDWMPSCLYQVSDIGESAFYNFSGYSGILNIYASVSIWSRAFYNCKFSSLFIPMVTYIGDEALYNCSNILSLGIYGVRYIGTSAIANCTNISGVMPLNSIQYIGSHAFENCENINQIYTTGSYLKYIGEKAFYNCRGISVFDMPVTVPTLVSIDAFEGCKSDYKIRLSNESVYNAYMSDPIWVQLSSHFIHN